MQCDGSLALLACVEKGYIPGRIAEGRRGGESLFMIEQLTRAIPATPAVAGSEAAATHGHGKTAFWPMVLGSIGVVYGDIGTSPLYALKTALHHTSETAASPEEVIGVVSLLIYALFFTVTVKYVFFLMQADNKGEGGTLSLMALAQGAIDRKSVV